jgi:GR25 family glycosyltransferase involved in LPS biosynthesis
VVYAAYEDLADVCAADLVKPPLARQQIAERGYLPVRKLDLRDIMRTTVAEMGSAKLHRLAASDRQGGLDAPTAETHDERVHSDSNMMATKQREAARIHLINLDRSPDRLAEFHAANGHLRGVSRFSAIDGTRINRSELVQRGVIEPTLGYTDGALGNTLSHLALWDLAIETGAPITLCEDDAVFHRDFEQKSPTLLQSVPPDWHIALWGYNFDSALMLEWAGPNAGFCRMTFRQDELRQNLPVMQTADIRPQLLRLAEGCGIVCYSISPAGAQLLKNFCTPLRNMLIRFEGLQRNVPNFALDVMMNAMYRRINAYACFPPLVVTPNDWQRSLTLGA